jgi:hypothetical protein
MLWPQFSSNFCEKIDFFLLKKQYFCSNFCLIQQCFEYKHHFFRWYFWRKCFQNHYIGPGFETAAFFIEIKRQLLTRNFF